MSKNYEQKEKFSLFYILMVELMVQNWNQLLSKFIFLHKQLQGNL